MSVYPQLSAENAFKIFDVMDVGVFITSGTGIVIYVNRSFERITTFKREDLLNRHISYLVDNGYISCAATLQVLEERKPISLIIDYKTKNDVLVTGTPIFGDDDTIQMVICTLQDWHVLTALREELHQSLEKAQQCCQRLQEFKMQQVDDNEFIARDKKTQNVLKMAARAANVDSTVLILGESGVGKDVLAKFIHKRSPRAKGPFIHINCGAIPDMLFESELFGYSPGAFTNAIKTGKPGLIELADQGTLFLDEIAELPMQVQVKLLRVLQEKCVKRLGEVNDRQVDVKIIAATNKDIVELVSAKAFRKDLFYRLNVVQILIPPLRERSYDIPVLVMHFLNQFNEKYQESRTFSLEILEAFMNYSWPGNVRELEHVVERVIVMCPEEIVQMEHLPPELCGYNLLTKEAIRLSHHGSLKDILEKIEEEVINEAISNSDTIQEAARHLGIDTSTLTRKKQKYKIFKKNYQKN